MTVFLAGSTTLTLIACACMSTVSSVDHSWAGAATRGGVPTHVVGIGSETSEL